jgi:hypothetical protein
VTPSPSSDGAFPNAAEQTLLARIDPAIARLCRRAATSDYPLFQAEAGYYGPLPIQAGLRCALGGSQPDSLFIWGVAATNGGGSTPDAYFFRRVSLTKATVGDCATDDRAYEDWSYGLITGRLLCAASPARARLDWIYDGEDVIATAERDDGDRAALYRWWLETGRSILH